MSAIVIDGPLAYAAPDVRLEGAAGQADEVVWWAVYVGISFAVALAWATYCRATGGYPEISFTWKGFKVACNSK
jgi:hypothetical protein